MSNTAANPMESPTMLMMKNLPCRDKLRAKIFKKKKFISITQLFSYSLLIAFIGFAVAALYACQPTVSNVKTTVIRAATANIHHESEMR